MVFRWRLSDNKSLQAFRTLLSILVDLNSAVVWIIFTCALISKSSGPCINPLLTVPNALITYGITITFLFHSFYSSPARSRYLSLFLLSFSFNLWSAGTTKFTIRQVFFFFFFFLLTNTRSGSLAEIRWSVFISKSERILCVSFSRTDSGLCIYHLFVWSNLNFLHNSQCITFPTQSCLVLYSPYANLLHSQQQYLPAVYLLNSFSCIYQSYY